MWCLIMFSMFAYRNVDKKGNEISKKRAPLQLKMAS